MESRPAWRAWVTLLRPPNLLTVPGDPLAGYLLAAAGTAAIAGPALAAVLAASLLLYAAGLLSNDYFDRAEDARDRPSRPIPSGAVPPSAVLIAALILSGLGLAAAACAGPDALAVAAVLCGLVWVYNVGAKRHAPAGVTTMGFCRGVNLVLGAAAAGHPMAPPVLWAAGGLVVYIMAVTHVARGETAAHRVGWPRWAPMLALTVTLGFLPHWLVRAWDHPPAGEGLGQFALTLASLAAFWAGKCGLDLRGVAAPALIQRSVGGWIRGLLLVQAALCAMAGRGGGPGVVALLLAFPLAAWLSRSFYGS